MREHRWPPVLTAGVLLSVAFAFPGVALAHAQSSYVPANGNSVVVDAAGAFEYQPDLIEQLPTNSTISVTFVDNSPIAHTFTIIGREGWVVPSTYSPTQIDALAYGSSPPSLFNSNVTSLGDQNVGSFISPARGWYEFLSTVSGQFQAGMYGFIAFGENLPANLTLTESVTHLSGSAISDSAVDLNWTNPPPGTFTNITVLCGTSNTSLTVAISAGTVSRIAVNNLNPATTYFFAVEVWNGSAHGPVTSPLAIATMQASSPGRPPLLGLNPLEWCGIVGAIVVVVAAVVLLRKRSRRAP